MVVRNQRIWSGGVHLTEGDYLMGGDSVGGEYGIKVDGITEEFCNELDNMVGSYACSEDTSEEMLDYTVQAVDEMVAHTYEIARDQGVEDWTEIDQERVRAQKESGDIPISNVCNGEWGDAMAAKCRERAVITQLSMDYIDEECDLGGLKTTYRSGVISNGEDSEYHAWSVAEIDGEKFVADPDLGGIQKLSETEYSYRERGIMGRFSSNKEATIS